ncbi:hypothetical protein GCM10009798_05050 [Nocardioides panacihumi]|uniref:Uncharacterized protein n=1 Tax=Nocardioides panacihumi TaxID=400774 RepID=A0ABN2QB66_9ACTN
MADRASSDTARPVVGRRELYGPPDDCLTVGVSTLAHAGVLAHLLRAAGLTARIDIGQQGMPATVSIDVPEDIAGDRPWRRWALEMARTIDPSSRRLYRRFKRRTSVQLSAPRHGAPSPEHAARRTASRTKDLHSAEGTESP